MKTQNCNYIVVIRSSNESTIKSCQELINYGIGQNVEVITIQCRPFEVAIRESFNIGIKSNKKWLVTIDADVLIRPEAISELINIGESLAENVFQFEGMLFDGLLLRYRQGGIKVYRVSLLKLALQFIPETGQELRPETYTQDQMSKIGYIRLRVNKIVGIHDFLQHPIDIFRKTFVHGQKSRGQIYSLIPIWQKLIDIGHLEYSYAIEGGKLGLSNDKKINLDISELQNLSKLYVKNDFYDYKVKINDFRVFVNQVLDANPSWPRNNKILLFLNYSNKYGLKTALSWYYRRLFYYLIISN